MDQTNHEQTLKKEEAVRRMKEIGLMDVVITDFKQSNKLYYSEHSPVGGILYWLENEPEWVEKVKLIEEQFDILVYHITHEHTEFGELLTMLYVNKYQDEWEQDFEDIKNKRPNGEFTCYGYCLNLTVPEFSEFGSVAMKLTNGGLLRVG